MTVSTAVHVFSRLPLLGFAICLSLLLSCARTAQAPNQTAAAQGTSATDAAVVPPDSLRLGDKVRPLAYELFLTLVPEKDHFKGRATIKLALAEVTGTLWLNADALRVDSAELQTRESTLPAEVLSGHPDLVGFHLPAPVGPGEVELRVTYEGKLPHEDDGGLFRRQENNEWYIFSQLEMIDARRVFPGLDQPDFKTPFTLTLTVPQADVAVANTPVVEQTPIANGMKVVRFAATKPLPTYLVALAVGPFEIVDAGTAGRNQTPIRILTPKGEAGAAEYAVASTGPILELLEEYFGSPYPYAKLDQIAIPSFFGAMENPGLVTYHKSLLLKDPKQDTIRRQRGFASICAHELGHMWFGDLVTLEWWNDAWLNEGFATWIASKIIQTWKPQWEGDVSQIRSARHAMWSDEIDTARQVREPIATKHGIRDAFDSITYQKGAAVLAMFESWVGEEAFRTGVRNYLAAHAHGNATAEDFLAALSEMSDSKVTAAFSTFIDQSGVPNLRTNLDCSGKKPTLSLAQNRYLPLGSEGKAERTWMLPVCVEYGAGKTIGRACTLLREAKGVLPLSDAKGCPHWVLPNADGRGYYRVEYSTKELETLLAKNGPLTIAERVAVINDMGAQVRSGRLKRGDALAWVPKLLENKNRHITAASIALSHLGDEYLSDELEQKYAHFIRAMYGARTRQLGWAVDQNEDENTRLLRPKLLDLVADEGHEKKLRGEARQLIDAWLKDHSAVHPDLVETALHIGALDGDGALWERLLAAAKAAPESEERGKLLGAMSAFEDPALVKKNLDLVLEKDFPIAETARFLFGGMQQRQTRAMTVAFLKQHLDDIQKRVPRFRQRMIPYLGFPFCSGAQANDWEAFLRPRIDQLPGAPRALDQVLERIRLCATQLAEHQAGVSAFLAGY